MDIYLSVVLRIIIVITTCGFGVMPTKLVKHTEPLKAYYKVCEEFDTHGSFHNDGSYFLKLDYSEDLSKEDYFATNWKAGPLPLNLEMYVHGGSVGIRHFGGNEFLDFDIEDTYCYLFIDRYENSDFTEGESLSKFTPHYTFGLYDFTTHTLYWLEYDL